MSGLALRKPREAVRRGITSDGPASKGTWTPPSGPRRAGRFPVACAITGVPADSDSSAGLPKVSRTDGTIVTATEAVTITLQPGGRMAEPRARSPRNGRHFRPTARMLAPRTEPAVGSAPALLHASLRHSHLY